MNNTEQILRKQLKRKENQIRVLLGHISGANMEMEVMESLACAFAFDLALNDKGTCKCLSECEFEWASAVSTMTKEDDAK